MSFLQPNDRNQEVYPQFKNGRVININEKPVEWYQPFDENKPNNSFQEQALYGIQSHSVLSSVYFSKENVKLVNDMIRYYVYQRSNEKYLIGDQSTIQIEILMRSIFLQHARHLPDNIPDQIKELNMMVVNLSVPRIISEALQYNGYVKDLEQNPVPLEHPKNMSSMGTKILKSVTSTF